MVAAVVTVEPLDQMVALVIMPNVHLVDFSAMVEATVVQNPVVVIALEDAMDVRVHVLSNAVTGVRVAIHHAVMVVVADVVLDAVRVIVVAVHAAILLMVLIIMTVAVNAQLTVVISAKEKLLICVQLVEPIAKEVVRLLKFHVLVLMLTPMMIRNRIMKDRDQCA